MQGSIPTSSTPFVGRRRSLRTLADLFERGERLITVTGVGGMGKTRLALEYARRRLQRAERVRHCDLTEAQDQQGLLTQVARSLASQAATPRDVLISLRRAGRLLLVLDNFEQLVGQTDVLRQWLRECPDLRLLVTSREVLRLDSEVVLELSPLDVDDPDGDKPSEALLLWSSLRQRLDPDYTTGGDDLEALQEILKRLDGIPLAIELAAARANLMSTGQLLSRLEKRFDLLRSRTRDRSPRRSTMEGALDWSWTLLEPWERDALAQSSVFRGGFDLEAAEAVVDTSGHADAPATLDVLQALRDKSLFYRVEGDASRLAMFGTIRDYGWTRLAENKASAAAVEQRHSIYFAERGKAWSEATVGPEGADALDRLAAELDNLLAVAARALSRKAPDAQEIEQGLIALVAADQVFSTRGPHGGHLELLDQAIACADALAMQGLSLSAALRVRGLLRVQRGDFAEGLSDLDRAVDLAAAANEPSAHARALLDLSFAHLRQRDLDRVLSLCEKALTLAREAGDLRLEGMALGAMGAPYKERGETAKATQLYEEALSAHRRAKNRRFEGVAHSRLAVLKLEEGAFEEVAVHAEAALRVHLEFGLRSAEALMLQILGGAEHIQGRLEAAREQYQESVEVAADIHDVRLQGTGLGYRGITELELGDLEAGRQHLEEAFRLTTEVGEHRHAALFRGYIGACEAVAGRPEDADEHLRQAWGILKAHPDARMEAALSCLEALPEVTRAGRGDEGARDRAEAKTRAAGAARRELLDPRQSSADLRIALRMVEHALSALEQARATATPLKIDPGGAWLEPPGQPRVDCRRRQALRRILVRLARQRIQQPGLPISSEALIAAGWPDEKMSSASAQNRLYVTINRLRQLGLGESLQLVEGGYRLDPDLPLALVPE